MKITRSATLPAGVEDAFALISSQEYQLAKVTSQAPDATAQVTDQVGGVVAIHSERSLPTQGMPGPVVSMVGSTLTITERQTWRPAKGDGSRTADLEITVGGMPVGLVGTITLSPTAAGSTMAVDADLTCTIPLFGKKIEEAAKPTIEETIDDEARLLKERLA